MGGLVQNSFFYLLKYLISSTPVIPGNEIINTAKEKLDSLRLEEGPYRELYEMQFLQVLTDE